MASSHLKRRSKVLSQKLLRSFHLQESSEALSLVISAIAISVLVGFAAVGFGWLIDAMGSVVHRARVTLGTIWGPLVAELSSVFPANQYQVRFHVWDKISISVRR